MRSMPVLRTQRLHIRPVHMEDLEAIHQLYFSLKWTSDELPEAHQREIHRGYVQWLSLNHHELARIGQPPYGDRAIVLRQNHTLIGMCGVVPYVAGLHVFPAFGGKQRGLTQAEVGLMWAIAPDHQRQGYATEAAQALIDYAFNEMHLNRIIATTGYDNIASQGVMRKVGMRVEENSFREPPWMQVLGLLENHNEAKHTGRF
jgi:ribosomal-protein-alanine N-acetyltransferase